jgi:NAD(P)-dependent dehydrogenase (short-subunit alcohol dehydrogenase family)
MNTLASDLDLAKHTDRPSAFWAEGILGEEDPRYCGSGKLANRAALLTGGEAPLGRAVAIAFAKEGADLAIVGKTSSELEQLCRRVQELGRRCVHWPGAITDEDSALQAVRSAFEALGRLDILVNLGVTRPAAGLGREQEAGFDMRTSFCAYYHLTRAVVPWLPPGSAIINTLPWTPLDADSEEPDTELLEYAASRRAILDFTGALASQLAERGIRVNGVAPGPTCAGRGGGGARALEPQNRSGLSRRPVHPAQIAPSYIFLASEIDSGCVVGQILQPNRVLPV